MASARRRQSLAGAPTPPHFGRFGFAAGGSAAVAAGGRTPVAGAASAAVAAGGRAPVAGAASAAVAAGGRPPVAGAASAAVAAGGRPPFAGAGSAAVAAGGRPPVVGTGSAAAAAAMFRPPRPLSTTAQEHGNWSGSAEASPFSVGFAPGSLDTEEEGDESRSGQMQDMLNCEQVDGEEAYTGYYSQDFSGYTDLLVNGVEETEPETPPNAGATAKNSQGTSKNCRSKNFREEEDILLVSGWLNVSMDPIQGVDQTQGSFWKRIHAYFHEHRNFESNRTEGSLMNRWSGIQHDVNLFCGYLSKIELRNHSGWTVDDKISHACTMFTKGDPKSKKFAFLHCWNILKDKPKWMDRRKEIGCAKKPGNKKQKTATNSSPAGGEPAAIPDDVAPEERPDGKKKEKQKLRQRRSTIEAMDYLMAKKKEADLEKDLKKEERCNKAFALQEERLKLEKDKFEFKRDIEEERILNLDLTTMSFDLQQYYGVRQREILARRCNI